MEFHMQGLNWLLLALAFRADCDLKRKEVELFQVKMSQFGLALRDLL
jgi:hypothetical protein